MEHVVCGLRLIMTAAQCNGDLCSGVPTRMNVVTISGLESRAKEIQVKCPCGGGVGGGARVLPTNSSCFGVTPAH